MPPATATRRGRRAALPIAPPRPSPTRDQVPRWDDETPSGTQKLRLAAGARRRSGPAQTRAAAQSPRSPRFSAARSSTAPEEQYQSLHRPERAKGADRIAGKRLHPARPPDFENAEGSLQRQDQRDEAKLPQLDADV